MTEHHIMLEIGILVSIYNRWFFLPITNGLYSPLGAVVVKLQTTVEQECSQFFVV